MKIDGTPPQGPIVPVNAQKARKNEVSSEKAVKDRVELSGKAREIARMKETIAQMPDVRTERVQSIQQAISDGTYKVDAHKVAGRLLDELA